MVRDTVKPLRILAIHDARLWEAIAPRVPKEWAIVSSQDAIPPQAPAERPLQLEVRETVRLVSEGRSRSVPTGRRTTTRGLQWCSATRPTTSRTPRWWGAAR